MSESLTFVRLSAAQIAKAKAANGPKRKITHALICGNYGQLFGTEKQCRKYFSAWTKIFPLIFPRAVETTVFEIADYKSTFNLVIKLIEANDALSSSSPQRHSDVSTTSRPSRAKKGFFARLFGL